MRIGIGKCFTPSARQRTFMARKYFGYLKPGEVDAGAKVVTEKLDSSFGRKFRQLLRDLGINLALSSKNLAELSKTKGPKERFALLSGWAEQAFST